MGKQYICSILKDEAMCACSDQSVHAVLQSYVRDAQNQKEEEKDANRCGRFLKEKSNEKERL